MLSVTDSGCQMHQARHLCLTGEEARLMASLLSNLPKTEGQSFYLCDQGHTHRVNFKNSHAILNVGLYSFLSRKLLPEGA